MLSAVTTNGDLATKWSITRFIVLSNKMNYFLILYRVSQEEISIFWEVTVSVILSNKNVYVRVSYSERFPRYSYFTVQ
jgi:hypothetical protein